MLTIFGINEPVIFATPIVRNPVMAISFIFPPFVSSLLTYSALYTEIVSLYTAVQVP
ncbi:hypothetical protein DOK78_002102 [Enterococcus sp. DIV2402]|uniref:Uncharacterized protein n=1 Tax=Candidatus Enterococcus lowellii TaxID=2230877 RepID=A0ABZ2SU83_9ENTE|nr:hypothetical protein [Enterococcus sp. DIV2402]MBO0463772.1 hypothetical protein [Enterococcus sp. DIV2402]